MAKGFKSLTRLFGLLQVIESVKAEDTDIAWGDWPILPEFGDRAHPRNTKNQFTNKELGHIF